MTRCVLCGHSCVPMADYDQPTCVACDGSMELIATLAAAAQMPRAMPREVVSTDQRAMVDAARRESARVYGATCPEAEPAERARTRGELHDAEIVYWDTHGQSTASIAFRLGLNKTAVTDALTRLRTA